MGPATPSAGCGRAGASCSRPRPSSAYPNPSRRPRKDRRTPRRRPGPDRGARTGFAFAAASAGGGGAASGDPVRVAVAVHVAHEPVPDGPCPFHGAFDRAGGGGGVSPVQRSSIAETCGRPRRVRGGPGDPRRFARAGRVSAGWWGRRRRVSDRSARSGPGCRRSRPGRGAPPVAGVGHAATRPGWDGPVHDGRARPAAGHPLATAAMHVRTTRARVGVGAGAGRARPVAVIPRYR